MYTYSDTLKPMEILYFQSILIYISLFVATYFEVFLMVTFIEHTNKLKRENRSMDDEPRHFPSVTIIVPCFNEEKTVEGTVNSLLAMNYPKDKFNVIIVDDGSTDQTWQNIQKFSKNTQIEIFKKENGGKYTALNYGIEKTKTDMVGCLDADSYVDPNALRRMVRYFDNPKTMAVTPAIKIFKPKSYIQGSQYIEYQIGVMIKKILAYLNAIHVTPGPFTIFRLEVFKKIGLFHHAHNTEDMEIAMRMHKYHLKIDNCHKAFIYTVGPRTLKALYKQRVRWTNGFIRNALDYKFLFLKKEYGNLAFLTLPFAGLSLISVITVVILAIWNAIVRINNFFARISVVGFHPHFYFNFSWIYLNTKTSIFVTLVVMSLTMAILIGGRKISEEKILSKEIIYFFIIYPFIAPLWVFKSVYNVLFNRKTSWR